MSWIWSAFLATRSITTKTQIGLFQIIKGWSWSCFKENKKRVFYAQVLNWFLLLFLNQNITFSVSLYSHQFIPFNYCNLSSFFHYVTYIYVRRVIILGKKRITFGTWKMSPVMKSISLQMTFAIWSWSDFTICSKTKAQNTLRGNSQARAFCVRSWLTKRS